MSSLITLLCIFGISIFMYLYINMYNYNKCKNKKFKDYKIDDDINLVNNEKKEKKIKNNIIKVPDIYSLEIESLLFSDSNLL